ncbi:MAG: hypothetical protein QOI74_1445 [Micromonosporaceae bacterium]|nr:hypothetical protein [Micromonosporaceae bacterium]
MTGRHRKAIGTGRRRWVPWPGPTRRRADRGSASLWMLGISLAVLTFAGAVAAAGTILVARHRAQAAADLGALGGAVLAVEGGDVACDRSRRIVEANGARLVSCQLDGFDVVVGVEVTPAAVARFAGSVRAWARAGPSRAAGADSGHPAGLAAQVV